MSQFPVYLPGLEEVVTHVFYRDPEGFLHKRTLRADGSVARLADLQVEEQAAFEARFGRVTAALARRVESGSPDERILVGAVFDPNLGPELEQEREAIERGFQDEEREFFEALRGGRVRVDDDGEVRANDPADEPVARRHAERRERQREHLRAQDEVVLTRSRVVKSALTSRGNALEPMESSTPIVYLWVDAGAVATLARDPDVSWLFDATPGDGREHAAPNGMSMHKISLEMNGSPHLLDGNGQKVGLIENVKCAIHDKHDAFFLAPATQYNSSGSLLQSCTTDAQCSNFCKTAPSSEPGVCRQLKSGVMRCVDPHLSWVASGIWGAKHESGYKNYGASRATPFVWTGSSASATNTACVVSETQAAYDWFNLPANQVKTVVGSYGCSNDSEDGFIEDWNVARRDVAIFKAVPSGQAGTYPGCRAANAVCVGGMTTGGASPIDGWQNPSNFSGSYFLDREEPDLVAFAGDRPSPGVDVISLANTTAWEQKTGTSFANPLVANMATLLKQKCGGTIGPRYLRAILMAGSWYFDPESSSEGGLAYSTQPKPGITIDPMLPGYIKTGFGAFGKDYKDGAGGPAGNNVLGWCNVAQPGLTFDGGPITVSSDPNSGTPFTRPSGTSGTYNLTGEGGQSEESPFHTLSYDTTNLKTAWSKVYTFSANTRVRAVFTTDKCTPTLASGPGSGPYSAEAITADFDLYLCPASGGGSCVGESRSVYDNNEGFDVTVSTAGSYRLSVIFDADASLGCNGSFSQNAATAVVYGSPSSFIEAP